MDMNLETKLQEGEALALAGRKAEAEAVFRDVLAAEPAQVRAMNNLAVLALAGQRPEEAGAWLERALAINPDDLTTLGNVLVFYARQNNWRQARAAAAAILARRPEDMKTLRLAARAEASLEDYPAARAKIDRLLASASPPEAEDLELSAFIRLKSGDREGAAGELRELLLRQPHRGDLAARLALCSKPETAKPRDLWPDPTARPPLDLAETYRQTWAGIPTTDPALRAAQILGHLHDPLSLSEADLPLAPPPPPKGPPEGFQVPNRTADAAGLSIMFAPTIVAGQSALTADWLRGHKVKTATVEVASSYLGYQADYLYPKNQAEIPEFINLMMKRAEAFDFLCLEFGSSFSYFPYFLSRLDYRREKTQPFAELGRLKDKGVKIIFQFWGSDHTSQSIFQYVYLSQLGFTGLPKPPPQTLFQYRNIMAASELADVFLTVNYGLDHLPRWLPQVEICIDPDRWPMKTSYRPRLEKILTAPTSPRKKNYTLILSAINSFVKRHPETGAFRVQNTPHEKVPAMYSEADLGIDQATVGFGALALEMMALGLPVILFRPEVGGFRDCAPVLSFSNIRELAARLEECAADPGRLPELGRQGRDFVNQYHSIDVRGRFFSRMMARVAAGEEPGQVHSEAFARGSRIWAADPEKVYNFRFYDVAVPLFCALGEWENAYFICLDALDCDWREEKFAAWLAALNEKFKFNVGPYKAVPESQAFTAELTRCRRLLNDSKALLDEYGARSAEAALMKEGSLDWYEIPNWLSAWS